MTESEQITIEDCANVLRGMTMDPRIPADTKSVMRTMIADLEAMIEEEDEDDDEPDPNRLREDRDECRRLDRQDLHDTRRD